MRVVAGSRKGRKLIGPKSSYLRPTTDRTKVFIFDYLGDSIVRAMVLDLFSGTGGLGIEALSRGAAYVTFLEKDRVSSQIIRKNLSLTQFESHAQVIVSDVFRHIKWIVKNDLHFDIILADPPYETDVCTQLLRIIDDSSILNVNGVFVLEHRSRDLMNVETSRLILEKVRKLGNTTVSFFTRMGE